MTQPTWQAGRFRIDLSAPKIMGIVNLTPDSFSDGGTYSRSAHAALAHAERLLAEGAHILDIGGESTRPGAAHVPPEEEWARLQPIVSEIAKWSVPLSVDTRRSAIMQRLLGDGLVDIINDVSALEDSGAIELLAAHPDTGICLMHMQGLPETMQNNPQYQDVVSEVAGYLKARERLEALREQLRQSVALPLSLGSAQTAPQHETGEARYKEYVRRIRQYILDGDCMQVVPSQRMSLPFADKPLSLYRALRTLNPSPYLFYYDFGDFHIVGSSPEILVRRERNQITVRPIAGTRLRGKTPEEDAAQAESLLADAKEIAEHVMLIDLGRNDVGRISQTGSVKVSDKMVIERYSHVMHIVSNVEGELKPGIGNMDILAATFPAGTLSGAPKVRALEIIEELEPAKRCIYGGAVGNWSFNNDMDLAIAIRTAVIKNGTLYVQSGGGIVADSDEEAEWQETQNKARAVLRAAEMVQQGLDG